MKAEARLVHTETGTNYASQWRGHAVGPLDQGKSYSQDFTFLTDTVSPRQDWALHLKYT